MLAFVNATAYIFLIKTQSTRSIFHLTLMICFHGVCCRWKLSPMLSQFLFITVSKHLVARSEREQGICDSLLSMLAFRYFCWLFQLESTIKLQKQMGAGEGRGRSGNEYRNGSSPSPPGTRNDKRAIKKTVNET